MGCSIPVSQVTVLGINIGTHSLDHWRPDLSSLERKFHSVTQVCFIPSLILLNMVLSSNGSVHMKTKNVQVTDILLVFTCTDLR